MEIKENVIKLGRIPYLITHWGIFLNLLILLLLLGGAHNIKYPEIISSSITIISNDSCCKKENIKMYGTMNITSSLNDFFSKDCKIDIALNQYPVEQYGVLTGKIKYKKVDHNSEIIKLFVVIENNISNTGQELIVRDNEIGIGSIIVYRISLLEKLWYYL